ncbi:hypothetical protein [Nocardia sp. CNY236]|uniref:hypothetical protein n=1 Tax=Nocardia sp. CNY236 TaxID=1169152 RepID=UPI0003F7A4F2|nr:hypothetical protein [Nocardia sp. CNY236]
MTRTFTRLTMALLGSTAIVVAVISVATNVVISFLVRWLGSRDGRSRRSRAAPTMDYPLSTAPVVGTAG